MALEARYAARQDAFTRAHRLKMQLEDDVPKLEKRAAKFQRKADDLAAVWKPMVQASREAYLNDDHEMAKQLSRDFQPIKAQCEEINERVREIWDRIAELRQAVSIAFHAAHDLSAEIKDLESRGVTRDKPHGVSIVGFDASPHGPGLVADLIRSLPKSIWEQVGDIVFDPTPPRPDRQGWQTQGVTIANVGGINYVPTIGIYGTPKNAGPEDFVHTVVHESGHIVWDRMLRPKDRRWWTKRYERMKQQHASEWPTRYADVSASEFFCETFALACRESEAAGLERDFPVLYGKIQGVRKHIR